MAQRQGAIVRLSRISSAVLAFLVLSAGAALAQCAGGLLSNCPAAVDLQSTDIVYGWQYGQNPHSRSMTVLQLGTAALTANFASPPPIGDVLPNTGAFTTLGASGLSTLTGGALIGGNAAANPALVINGPLADTPRLQLWNAGTQLWSMQASSNGDLIFQRTTGGVGAQTFSINNSGQPGDVLFTNSYASNFVCVSGCNDNLWSVPSDVRPSTTNWTYWAHQATYGGGATDGSRAGGSFILQQTGDVVGTHVGVSTALGSQMNINGSAGGSSGNYVGGYTAFNPSCILGANTHFIAGCTGGEVNFEALTGSSYFSLAGWQFILEAGHAIRGDGHIDSGFIIASQAGASAGLDYGLMFGNPHSGQAPFNSTATIINASYSPNEGTAPLAAARGIDFLSPAFTGAAFRSLGFRVGPGTSSGNTVNIGTAQIVAGATGTAIDTTGAVATATTLNAGGSGWAVNDIFEVGTDGLGIVNSLSGSAVATYTIKKLPYDFSGSPPATLTATAVAPSGGSALVLNVTWNSSVKTLNLGTTTATAINVGNSGSNITLAGTLTLATSSTGAATQTFTNSPCSGLTTEQWVPVQITGQTGTWFIPACQ